jgi:hypothetical protein
MSYKVAVLGGHFVAWFVLFPTLETGKKKIFGWWLVLSRGVSEKTYHPLITIPDNQKLPGVMRFFSPLHNRLPNIISYRFSSVGFPYAGSLWRCLCRLFVAHPATNGKKDVLFFH